MIDPVEDIADGLVAFLNGLAAGEDTKLSLEFAAEKNDEPSEQLYKEKQTNLRVFVVPGDEAAEKIGRGGQALESYRVAVVIVKQVTTEYTVARLSQFAREMRLAIRHAARIGTYPWSGSETTRYDRAILRSMNQFASGTTHSFTAIR